MKNKEDMIRNLREEAGQLEIPESVEPEMMRKLLKQQTAQKAVEKQKIRKIYRNTLAFAACLCIALGFGIFVWQSADRHEQATKEIAQADFSSGDDQNLEIAENVMEYPTVSYQDIYDSMSVAWGERGQLLRGEDPAAAEPTEEAGVDGAVYETAAVESAYSEEKQMNAVADLAENEFGTTNVQTVGVDEGDIVKNDGRYLYQRALIKAENESKRVIQIIDTKDGLKEVGRIEGVESMVEFYVWEDVLVVIENKYLENEENGAMKELYACVDIAYNTNYYQEITFFDIEDRSQPREIRSFTLQGEYASSRIADGYFYGVGKYYASPGEGVEDYDAYVPKVDGERLAESRIYLPADSEATSYLVLVAVDLRNPTEFTDTTGVVTGADLYYVSSEYIYVADANAAERTEGWSADTTSILKFSYGDGKFAFQAKGKVSGTLEGSFSMDEYEDHLRVVSTVWEYERKQITDDRTGETLGYDITDNRQTNALYVLDEDLKVVGKIEGLAEDEQIYSARFMGNTGYFVTFRQTDPLFTVDLSKPEEPKILSELKVSGFSEYLHIYGEDRLLGIGMEADEETGVQQGMKLSMFDISDKSDVKEIAKLPMENYNYSEALYNHRAVMISTTKNLFGFAAEGSGNGEYWRHYFVYAYENDEFVQKLKIDTKDADGRYYTTRGTFIGDVFYLLCENGSVRSYDLNTGAQLESLEP